MEVSFAFVGDTLPPDSKLLHNHQARTIISTEAGTIISRRKPARQPPAGMPTMGRHTASAMDEVLDEADREDAPNGDTDVL